MKTRDFNRTDRVAATVKRVLAGPLSEMAKRCGVELVTLTRVELSRDLRRGTVYLSVYGDGAQKTRLMQMLSRDARELQTILANSLRTKRTPVLDFRGDDSLAQVDRIARLLDGRGNHPDEI